MQSNYFKTLIILGSTSLCLPLSEINHSAQAINLVYKDRLVDLFVDVETERLDLFAAINNLDLEDELLLESLINKNNNLDYRSLIFASNLNTDNSLIFRTISNSFDKISSLDLSVRNANAKAEFSILPQVNGTDVNKDLYDYDIVIDTNLAKQSLTSESTSQTEDNVVDGIIKSDTSRKLKEQPIAIKLPISSGFKLFLSSRNYQVNVPSTIVNSNYGNNESSTKVRGEKDIALVDSETFKVDGTRLPRSSTILVSSSSNLSDRDRQQSKYLAQQLSLENASVIANATDRYIRQRINNLSGNYQDYEKEQREKIESLTNYQTSLYTLEQSPYQKKLAQQERDFLKKQKKIERELRYKLEREAKERERKNKQEQQQTERKRESESKKINQQLERRQKDNQKKLFKTFS
jgi:hypothetical protein